MPSTIRPHGIPVRFAWLGRMVRTLDTDFDRVRAGGHGDFAPQGAAQTRVAGSSHETKKIETKQHEKKTEIPEHNGTHRDFSRCVE
jgi:hypothetical protein